MEYLFLSFVAGALTVLAPCVLPILPVVLGSSLDNVNNKLRPIMVVVSLGASIVIFTLLLRASTALIMIDPRFWNFVSGGIIFAFGLFTLFPSLWTWLEIKLNLSALSGKLLHSSVNREGNLGAILVGFALGPVFTSCSPTYGLIVAVILPLSFFVGFVNLLAYALGLITVFGLIAIGGQRFLSRVRWIANPRGSFRKFLGVLFVFIGVLIMFGLEKRLEAALLDIGFGNGLIEIESKLRDTVLPQTQ